MPQRTYSQDPVFRCLPGQVMSPTFRADSKIYALQPNTWTVTFGGTAADGTYSFRINGTTVPTVRSGGSPSTNTALAAAADAYMDGVDEFNNLVLPSNASGVLTLTARHTDDRIVIDQASAPGGATLVAAETVGVSPAILPVGSGLIRSSTTGQIRVPQSGDADAAFAGVAMRVEQNMRPIRAGEPTVFDGFEGGAVVSAVYDGDIAVYVDETVTEGDTPNLRITGTGVGFFGNDTDSGARIALTGCRFVSGTFTLPYDLLPTGAVGVAIARFNRP